jgi:DNA-binding Lrp family transcriptional regulator
VTEEIKVRDRRDAGWFWISNQVVTEYGPKVGAYGIAVYTVLAQCSREDHSKTTLRQLSSLLNISPQTAMRALEKLSEYKLIRETKKSLSPSQGPSEYDLLSVPIGNGGNGSVPIGNSSVPVRNGSVPIGNTYKTSNTYKTKEEPKSYPSKGSSLFEVEEPKTSNKKLTRSEKENIARNFTPPIHIPKMPWDAWVEMRIEKGNCPTLGALQIAVSHLEKLKLDGSGYTEVLNESTLRGWQGLFATKNHNGNGNGNGFHNGTQSRTNGSGQAGHLLDHLPSLEENQRRQREGDERLARKRAERGM